MRWGDPEMFFLTLRVGDGLGGYVMYEYIGYVGDLECCVFNVPVRGMWCSLLAGDGIDICGDGYYVEGRLALAC